MITCDKCAFCSPTPGGILYCAWSDHFVPNIGCEDGKPFKTQTNADRIRSMSDEELAQAVHDMCIMTTQMSRTTDWWLDWLKTEVTDKRT